MVSEEEQGLGPPSITPTLRDNAGTLEVGAHSQHPPQDLVLVANTHWAQGSPHMTLNNHARSHGSPLALRKGLEA